MKKLLNDLFPESYQIGIKEKILLQTKIEKINAQIEAYEDVLSRCYDYDMSMWEKSIKSLKKKRKNLKTKLNKM